MPSLRPSIRDRLRLQPKAETQMVRSVDAAGQPTPTTTPSRRIGKQRPKVSIQELETPEANPPPSERSAPARSDTNLSEAALSTPQTTMPTLPMLHKPPNLQGSDSPLLNLPPDLILTLSSHLPWDSLLALRSTCTPLYTLLNSTHLTMRRHNLVLACLTSESLSLSAYRAIHPRSPRGHLWDLFYAAFEWQLLERPAKHLTCYGCLQVKPLSAFVERMSSRGTGLGGRKASQRRCKECMRRGISIAGVWWREHWVRKAEVRRRQGRGERAWGWIMHHHQHGEDETGRRGEYIKEGEEVGVCNVCGTGQFELFWGCAGCFEKEEERRRKEEWGLLGLERPDGAEMEGWVRWVLERAEKYRDRKEKRRRRRHARRAEGGGKWWSVRRLVGWVAGETWSGSWGERVEALVEYLNGPEYQLRGRRTAATDDEEEEEEIVENVDIRDHRRRVRAERANNDSNGNNGAGGSSGKKASPAENENYWRAIEQVPVRKDRRETRCSMCWVPTARPTYTLGLAYEPRLSLERCCDECQLEHAEKRARRKGGGEVLVGREPQKQQQEREGKGDDADEEEGAFQGLRDLYSTTSE